MSAAVEFSIAEFQDEFISSDAKRVAIIGAKGSSKAQPLSEPVLTPKGFVEMGAIQVGDQVVGSDGKPVNVLSIHPQGVTPVFRVEMSDGTYVRATHDHLWAVQTGSQRHRGSGYKVLTTEQIQSDLKTSQGWNKWYLPLVEPVHYETNPDLVIPPYSLGAILGDGGLTKREVTFSTNDPDILNRVCDECQTIFSTTSAPCDFKLTKKDRDSNGWNTNHLVLALDEMGLIGIKSHEKYIPEPYLLSRVDERLNLLRGLMDTNGHAASCGTAAFSTTSPALAEGVVSLCRSLGLVTKATRYSQKEERYLDYFVVRLNAPFNPFWLKRKAKKFNVNATQGRSKSISNITPDGHEDCQCIRVDSKDNLYVTRDYTLTHNTWSGARFLLSEVVAQPREQHLVMLNTLGQARDVFVQDIEPLLKDLNWPYHFHEQFMRLKIFGTVVHLRSAEADAISRIESISYGSGWADEASFYDPESLKIFLSRVRKGKRKVRVTSMPDDPDHWMYDLLEDAKFIMHEISLYDNPDKEFVKNYEEILKSFYSPTQLQRYLSGERVSLAGSGLFSIEKHLKKPVPYDPEKDVYLYWDFNVLYRAVSGWQDVGVDESGRPIIGCFKSWKLEEATIVQDAKVLAGEFHNHKAVVYLSGDATEDKKNIMSTESAWASVERVMKDELKGHGVPVRNVVPTSNPNVIDSIECTNWALLQGLMIFDPSETHTYRSLSGTKANKYGEPDKSTDYTETGAKTHHGDTARYIAWENFQHLYPGGSGKPWAL